MESDVDLRYTIKLIYYYEVNNRVADDPGNRTLWLAHRGG